MSLETQVAELEETWDEPVPLPSALPPVQPFDPDLLPDALRGWIVDISERMQCPPDFPAIGAMVALSSVVGRQIGIRPKRHDDWLVVPNLWGAVIGRPSVMKTPALAESMKAVHRLEAGAFEEFQEAQKEAKADEILLKQTRSAADSAIRNALKKKDKAEAERLALEAASADEVRQVIRRRYVTSDATVEALGEILAENPRGVMLFRDELVGWLDSLHREGREGARQFFLESWNGYGRFTYDRIGRGTIDIEACCVSVLGGIQPGPLARHLTAVQTGGSGDDGLIQRLQLAVWPDLPTSWTHVDRKPDQDARDKALNVFTRLDTIAALQFTLKRAEDEVPFLRFDEAAQGVFDAWRSGLEERIRHEEHPALEAHLAKYRSLVPSIALIHYLADTVVMTAVNEVAVTAGIAWADYLESHARRIYHSSANAAVVSAQALLKKIEAGKLESPFAARDAYRNSWQHLSKSETYDALKLLDAHGYVRPVQITTLGRPKTEWHVHPKWRKK